MSLHKIVLSVVSIASLSACGTASLTSRIDELEAERADLVRQGTDLQAQLTECRTRCAVLERGGRVSKESATTERAAGLPDDLSGQGIQLRKNGNGETVIDIPSDVFFSSGVSTLSSRGTETISRVAEHLRRTYPGAALRVEGHADTDPIRRSKGKFHCNWDLSLQRAHSVVHYLVDEAHFDPRTITCAGFGEFHPQDPSNKSKNRRVEIVILQ